MKLITKRSRKSIHSLRMRHPIIRQILELTTFDEVYDLSQRVPEFRKLSKFIGDVVKTLKVQTVESGQSRWVGYTSYSQIVNRRNSITPLECLDVHIGMKFNAKRLISKIGVQVYTDLRISGNYHWKQVLPLLHPRVQTIYFNDNMDLPLDDVKIFFKKITKLNIKKFFFFNSNADEFWIIVAEEIFKSQIGVSIKSVNRYDLLFSTMKIVKNDGTFIFIVSDILPDEPMEEDVDQQEINVSDNDNVQL